MAELVVGPVVTPADVEEAVRTTMANSIPFYLAEIDLQHSLPRGTTKPPRLYVSRADNERWAEEPPPILVVACPGTVGPPERHGDRASYGAWWQVNVAVTVGGATESGSRALAGRHLAAVTLALSQQTEMGGLTADSRWQGGRVDAVPPQRTLLACEGVAHVYVARVVDSRGLLPRDIPEPTQPTPAPPTIPPTGLRVRVTGPENT